MKELLLKNPDCTGVIAFSDLVAMQVCYVAKALGKNVPEDLSVIGFDDIVSKFCLPVMLSSVTSSKTKMSLKATEILMEKISDENAAVSQVVLPTHVVLRETSKKITGRS
jgi:LacI family transcriptional regulator